MWKTRQILERSIIRISVAVWCAVFFFAACGREGCLPQAKVVVVYRGDSTLDETAAVVRKESQVGYIEKVARGGGVQRVVVRLQRAGALRRNDRFLPRRDERGKVGFLVVPGMGDPLDDGAEIEAGFAPPPQIVQPAEPIPDAMETGRRATEDRQPAHAADGKPHAAEQALDALRRSGKASLTHVPAALRDEVFSIPDRMRGMAPGEAANFIDNRRLDLKLRFDEAIAEAQERGDRETIRGLRSFRAKTEPILRQMQIEASRANR